MSITDAINSLALDSSELAFFQGIRDRKDTNISKWARQYHYFSLHQAPLLAKLVVALDPLDHRSLTIIAKSLYEEYGSGAVDQIHSRLFATFCHAVGIAPTMIPIRGDEVVPQLTEYLDGIDAAYSSGDLSKALGSYCFLERSAVLSYPTMLAELRRVGFSDCELTFFATHVIQEKEHDTGAISIANCLIDSHEAKRSFACQFRKMEVLWRNLWGAFLSF